MFPIIGCLIHAFIQRTQLPIPATHVLLCILTSTSCHILIKCCVSAHLMCSDQTSSVHGCTKLCQHCTPARFPPLDACCMCVQGNRRSRMWTRSRHHLQLQCWKLCPAGTRRRSIGCSLLPPRRPQTCSSACYRCEDVPCTWPRKGSDLPGLSHRSGYVKTLLT